jgi:hypothetical protein
LRGVLFVEDRIEDRLFRESRRKCAKAGGSDEVEFGGADGAEEGGEIFFSAVSSSKLVTGSRLEKLPDS